MYCFSVAVLPEVKKLANLRLSGAADAQLRVRLNYFQFYFVCGCCNVFSSILHVIMLGMSWSGSEWEFMASIFLLYVKLVHY